MMTEGLNPAPREERICAIITTLNEERDIAQCIRSLLWCDEVLVVDSYSSDATEEIVRSFEGVRFEQHTYYGSAAQKNWAMDRCSTDWILIFDADERCPDELRSEIEALLVGGPDDNVYRVRRRLFFLGRHIRFCGWHRDLVVRMTRRGHARYPNRRVHADMVIRGSGSTLKNPLDHYMVRDLSEYAYRICKYGIWGAAQGWKEGRRSGLKEVAIRPLWRFIRAYFVQGGFLDGIHGFAFCSFQAFGTFVKWSVLWGWRLTGDPQLPEFDENEETWKSLESETSAAQDLSVAGPTGG